jgi:RecA-family ATPase
MTFDSRGIGDLTPLWLQLESTMKKIRPALIGIDTAADTYGGNEIIRNQVRQFIQRGLTALAVRYSCAVILTAHPSQAGNRGCCFPVAADEKSPNHADQHLCVLTRQAPVFEWA